MRDEQADQSVSCADGEHDDCPHKRGIEYGVNPFRRRPKSRVLLCMCECHASCPVMNQRRTVPVPVWRESCTCPAAADVPSSVGRGQNADAARTPWLSPARVAALNAARDRAAGQSPEQVKELYQAELRARGLDVPMKAVLDVEVSLISGDYPPDTGLAGRALIGLVKRLHGIGRPAR
jgi:hypothetical protein